MFKNTKYQNEQVYTEWEARQVKVQQSNMELTLINTTNNATTWLPKCYSQKHLIVFESCNCWSVIGSVLRGVGKAHVSPDSPVSPNSQLGNIKRFDCVYWDRVQLSSWTFYLHRNTGVISIPKVTNKIRHLCSVHFQSPGQISTALSLFRVGHFTVT